MLVSNPLTAELSALSAQSPVLVIKLPVLDALIMFLFDESFHFAPVSQLSIPKAMSASHLFCTDVDAENDPLQIVYW